MRNPSACSGVPVVHDGAPPSRAVNALAEAPFKGNIIGAVVDDVVLLSEDVGPVRRLTLNRPRSLNALNKELLEALESALDAAASDDAVHVVVIRGAGRAFCSGYDLNEDASGEPMDARAWLTVLKRDNDRMMRIFDHPKPVIASVHSYCLAGVADDAFFGYVDVRFGSGVVSMFLPWVIGVRAAKELLFTGEDRVPAPEALRLGLVNRVVPRDRLHEGTAELADQIAMNEPHVVAATKRAVNRVWEVAGFRDAMDANVEIDVDIETANLPMREEFRRITQERGLKAAIAWRDAQYRGDT